MVSITGFKKNYIYDLVKREKIPFYKVNHSVRFDRKEIDLWMRSGRPDLIRLGVDKLNEIIERESDQTQ